MNQKETQGEDLIADFLDDKGIKFERYVQIKGLISDDKFFREADFYLPQYKTYVEFLGMWNDPEHQQRYRQKMSIYAKNGIPCVYLWPDNLGTLDWILKRRITETLLKYDKKWQLVKIQWKDYTDKMGIGLWIVVAMAVYLWKTNPWSIGWSYTFLGILIVGGAGEIYIRFKKLKKIKNGLKW